MGDAPWALRWNAWVSITQAGLYTVTVIADDGVGLSIAGVSVIYSLSIRDTGPLTAGVGVNLTPGNLYQLQVSYLNYTSTNGANFRLLWTRPDGVTEDIPASALRARSRRDYYSFGGAVVAMKEGVAKDARVLTYLHGDHLGSVSLATNAAGQKVSEQRYKPYGEVRWASGAGMPTDFTFTSQRAGPAGYVGSLTDYVARFYSPALGRFVSADTIVPGAGNPQAFNRYMYVLGNPLGRTDPSGHGACSAMSNQEFWDCRWYTAHGFDNSNGKWEHTGKVGFEDLGIITELLREGGTTWKGDTANWALDELESIAKGVSDMIHAFKGADNLRRLLGNQTLTFVRRIATRTGCSSHACADFSHFEIEFNGGWNTLNAASWFFDAVHEIGHFIGEVSRTPWGLDGARGFPGGFTGYEKYSDAFPWRKDSATTQYAKDNDTKGNPEYFADAISRFVYPTYDRPNTKQGQPLHVDQSNWLNHVIFGYAIP